MLWGEICAVADCIVECVGYVGGRAVGQAVGSSRERVKKWAGGNGCEK